jgi:hypothetical protein
MMSVVIAAVLLATSVGIEAVFWTLLEELLLPGKHCEYHAL